jgi:hypothetical protein
LTVIDSKVTIVAAQANRVMMTLMVWNLNALEWTLQADIKSVSPPLKTQTRREDWTT